MKVAKGDEVSKDECTKAECKESEGGKDDFKGRIEEEKGRIR